MSHALVFELSVALSLGAELSAPGARVVQVADEERGTAWVCLKRNALTEDDDAVNATEWSDKPGALGPMVRKDVLTQDYSAFGAALAFVREVGEDAAREALKTSQRGSARESVSRERDCVSDARCPHAREAGRADDSPPASCSHQWDRRPDLDQRFVLRFVCARCGAHGWKKFGINKAVRVYSRSSRDAAEARALQAFEDRREERARFAGVYAQDHLGAMREAR